MKDKHAQVKLLPSIMLSAVHVGGTCVWQYFYIVYLALNSRIGATSKVYQWLGPRCRTKNLTQTFRTLPLILRGGQNLAWIFDHMLAFQALWFRNGATYQKSKTSTWRDDV